MENNVVKYVAAGVVLGSLFYLSVIGKMPASQYVQLAELVLAALGGYHAGRFQGGNK